MLLALYSYSIYRNTLFGQCEFPREIIAITKGFLHFRTSKGRKLSLPLYVEEDSEDLSDLGLSSNKNEIKSSTILEENDVSNKEKE